MLEGTKREVLELLLERPRSPTEVADELGVSVQTASRNLKQLVEQEFAERTYEGGERGYKRYRAREFAQVFAGYESDLFTETLELSPEKRAVLSVWRVPQTEYHPYLMSYLFFPDWDRKQFGTAAIVVYGSVARGDAKESSDVDILLVHRENPTHSTNGTESEARESVSKTFSRGLGFISNSYDERVFSEEWFTISEFQEALDAGSQFLRNVLDEGITLYDPEGVIRDAKRERAGEHVPQ